MPNTTNIQIALSVRQPWAWLIIRPDIISLGARVQLQKWFKDIENRTWLSKYRGPLLIHAAQGFTWQEYCDCQNFINESDIDILLPDFESFDLGGIIGQVEMKGCVSQSNSKWFTGPYGFQLTNQQVLPFRPYKGQQKFFQVAA